MKIPNKASYVPPLQLVVWLVGLSLWQNFPKDVPSRAHIVIIIKSIIIERLLKLSSTFLSHDKGRRQKKWYFRPKRYPFLLLLPFDAEAFKTCKNTIKLIHLCALPCLWWGVWLTLKVYFDLA